MLVQGEGLKYGIEHYRRRKFHCSGSVFWQYNDAWPCISWSIVDYYLRPKAGYFFVKRAYAPVLASFKAKEDGSFSLWITNDTLKSISDRVTWSLRLFTGEVVDTAVVDITVPANSNQKIAQIPKGVAQKVDPRKSYLYVTSENGIFPDNRLFLTDFKEWIRATPVLSVEKCRTSKGVDVRIRSNVFAYSVSIYTPSKQARYSDNYFDLLPGVEKVIYVWNDSPDPISLAEIFVSCL
jgi:beta-mannosidase